MTQISDGGPAFPMITDFCPLKGIRSVEGMSLRDYFAGQCVQCLLNSDREFKLNGQEVPPDQLFGAIALTAYTMADCMLMAREETKSLVSDTESEVTKQDREL